MNASRLLLLSCLAFSIGCERGDAPMIEQLTGGSIAQGKFAFKEYGCGTCHEVHGVGTAQGHAGPAFHDFARQQYLPGGLPNTPDNLVHWLRTPRAVSPNTAMPDLGLSEQTARHLSAYLYSLE